MAKVVIPNTVEFRLVWDFNGQGGINVLHALKQASFTTVDQGLADRIDSAIKTQYASQLAPQHALTTQLLTVTVRDVSAPDMIEFIGQSAAVPGSGTGDELPRQTALVVTIRTGKAGRSGRGRIYYGGFTEAANDATSSAGLAATTAVQNFSQAIFTALQTEFLSLGVSSRAANAKSITVSETLPDGSVNTKTKNYPQRNASTNQLARLEVRDNNWDTQRRRNNGRMSPATLSRIPLHAFDAPK